MGGPGGGPRQGAEGAPPPTAPPGLGAAPRLPPPGVGPGWGGPGGLGAPPGPPRPLSGCSRTRLRRQRGNPRNATGSAGGDTASRRRPQTGGGAAPGTTLELGVPRPTPAPAVPPGFGAPLGFGVPALTRALLAASCAFRYSVIWGGQSWVTPRTLVGFGGSGSTGAWGDPHSPSGAVAGLGSISTGSEGDRDPPECTRHPQDPPNSTQQSPHPSKKPPKASQNPTQHPSTHQEPPAPPNTP